MYVNMGGREKCEFLLGCTIQSNLKWHVQIENLVAKLKTKLAELNKLKYIVPYSIRKIFTSVLVYCLPLFGGCEMFQIKDLQVL